ncbi:hypothetical protein ASE39_08745 [Acidovorax sp. Root267]|nr:hypothetical protein ASE39_08745 [Acidovorax sp. Root267]
MADLSQAQAFTQCITRMADVLGALHGVVFEKMEFRDDVPGISKQRGGGPFAIGLVDHAKVDDHAPMACAELGDQACVVPGIPEMGRIPRRLILKVVVEHPAQSLQAPGCMRLA